MPLPITTWSVLPSITRFLRRIESCQLHHNKPMQYDDLIRAEKELPGRWADYLKISEDKINQHKLEKHPFYIQN